VQVMYPRGIQDLQRLGWVLKGGKSVL
jgi:hypothetical protein